MCVSTDCDIALFQIPIATSGIRAMGYLMRHHLRTEGGKRVSQRIITQFVKVQQELLHSTRFLLLFFCICSSKEVLCSTGFGFMQIRKCWKLTVFAW